jgi:hypothetical protein
VLFYLIELHSIFLLHTLQVLYMCTVCDSTEINLIIEFVCSMSPVMISMAVLFLLNTHPVSRNYVYHLRIELSDGFFFPEFGAEFPLDNCN